jgi:PREDICTED: lethal (2) k09913-like
LFFLSQSLNTSNVIIQNKHKHITLRRGGETIPISQIHATHSPPSTEVNVVDYQRPLAVIFAWLAAQEKHIEKYRVLWLTRGFDVLTVKMSPSQFLAPTVGAKRLINDVLKFLLSYSKYYPEVVLHAFSVGAFEFGEMLLQLKEEPEFQKNDTKLLPSSDKKPNQVISESIKGIIFDSPVAAEGIACGVAKSISPNPFVNKIFENLINLHLKLSYSFATKHYFAASEYAHNSFLRAPALLFTSSADLIGHFQMSKRLQSVWSNLGIDVKHVNFDSSSHVQHYVKYPQEYCKQLDEFLNKLKLTLV